MKFLKTMGVLVLCLASMLLATSLVTAQTVSIVDVEVDGDNLQGGTESGTNVYSFDKNNDIDVKVRYSVDQDWDDVEVEVVLLGYEYNDIDRISDTSEPRDVKVNTVYSERLSLPLYRDLEDGQYDLRVRIAGRRGVTHEFLYTLDVEGSDRHSIYISDVVMSPAYSVRAGGALLVTTEVENDGRKDQKGVKVRVKIPELNQEATAYIQEVESAERTISEEAYLRIPSDTAEGDYEVLIELEYDRGRERDMVRETIHVTANPAFQQVTDEPEATEGQTVVAIGPDSQEVQIGTTGAVYSATLINTGSAAKTYTVTAQTSGGLDVTVSPSNVIVVEGGKSESVYLYVSATENSPVGEQLFVVSISSGDETLEEVSLTADVVGATKKPGVSVRRGLEVGLVVLLVLLLILGLIVGFNKLKGAEDEGEDTSGQTYY